MRRSTFPACALVCSLMAGCSGMSATQVGQTASAIVPGVGPLVGVLAEVVFEQPIDKGREQKEKAELSKQLGRPSSPGTQAEQLLGSPVRVWVDERVENGRLIDGRFDRRPVS